MPLDDIFAADIEEVRVSLVFFDFDADPGIITEALGILPDEVRRKGEVREMEGDRAYTVPHNLWALNSRSPSLDPNDQIRELLARVEVARDKIDPAWAPSFNILWKSTTVGAGAGPYYEKDVVQGIAGIGADIYQDLYLVEKD